MLKVKTEVLIGGGDWRGAPGELWGAGHVLFLDLGAGYTSMFSL